MTRLAAILLALVLTLPIARGEAQPAPYHHYRTLETPHFRVHVAQGLEREGRVAAAAAERAYAALSKELTPPRGTIDLVVSDDADYSNGYATPFPTNRIVVFANPPIESRGLELNEDWLGLVVTHELTHIFHLDRVRGVWAEAQHVLGRAPYLFPNEYGPAWLTEGLAVYYESRLTEGGRLKDAEHRDIARASASENALPRIDQLSLGTPRFPGGSGAYAYGSLFVDYLARTYGDSAVHKFVEAQSAQLIPVWLNRPAVSGFGVSFSDAFEMWRDSVLRSVTVPRPPLPGWRELTSHGYYASAPRWTNDSTLVYVGTDGRETNAAYDLTLTGARRRLGRRNGLGANAPAPDGSLVYAQLDFTGPSEIRSDLYRSWPDGRVERLTNDARLVQPDVSTEGTIVAVRLAAARSSLVLLDAHGAIARTLREAAPDETWSEPRWSPEGHRIAAVHRLHGGEFMLVVIDVGTGAGETIDHGMYVISSPSWLPGTDDILFTSEKFGTPEVARISSHVPYAVGWKPGPVGTGVGVFTPDVSPNGKLVAATTLRADGYHVGVAPTVAPMSRIVEYTIRHDADAQSLAPGDYHDYSPWPTLLPRYWYPVIESAPVRGTRLGFTTTGTDVLGRHLYDAYFAIPTTGRFAIGGIGYRYAGLREPLLDVVASQDWSSEGLIYTQTAPSVFTPIGSLLRRSQDLALSATIVRPRFRTYSTFTAGVGVERRIFATDPADVLARMDTSFQHAYAYPRAFVGATWGNAQRPALSISPEDGVAVGFTARERYRSGAASTTASASVVAVASAYKALDLPGFAHHVLALRAAGGVADARTATEFDVGGTSGGSLGVIPGYTIGEGRRTFSVRGFPATSVYGTQAATGSLEYRAPLLLGGRGYRLLPFFFDRASVTAFGDAGVAGCATTPLYAGICSPPPALGKAIASAGAELGLSITLLDWDAPQLVRIGFAVPVAGRDAVQATGVGVGAVSAYITFGLAY
jgi:hypothetical protein